MPANAIISNGISDTDLYMQAAANVAAPFTIDNHSGQYPAVGNVLVNRRLSNMWQGMYLDAKIFADGLGVTSMNATEEGAVAVRIPLLLPAPRNGRTLAINLGGRTLKGTPGNDEPFNNKLPHGLQTDAVDVYFRQLYDDAAQIAKNQMRMIGNNLDILGQYTSGIPQTVALLTDSDIMANQIGAALKRAKTNTSNVVYYDSTNTTTGYLQSVLNGLVSKLSNVVGGYKEGVISYPSEKSVIVMKYSLWNKFMTINNGAIVNSDIGQKMLVNGNFSEDGKKLLGGAIKGMYNGIYIKVVPDELWIMAAAYLGIPASALTQFNKVVAYIANAAGTYFGRASVDIDIDKANTTSMGFIVRNDWQWGTAVARTSSIALLIESANNGVDFTNPITGTDYDSIELTVAPADLEATIQEYQGSVEVNGTYQSVGIAPAGLITDITLTVSGTGSAAVPGAKVIVQTEGDDGIGYASVTDNGDGTYNTVVPRGTSGTIVIIAEGYETETVTYADTDTATGTKALTASLTAE